VQIKLVIFDSAIQNNAGYLIWACEDTNKGVKIACEDTNKGVKIACEDTSNGVLNKKEL
jgi:hypothetical protein